MQHFKKQPERPVASVPQSKTDWAALASMTDEDIAKAVAKDPDAAPILTREQWLKSGKVHPARITR